MTNLPGILGEIAEVIGVELATELGRKMGGREIYPSLNPGPDSALVRVIGMEAVRKIAQELGVEKRLLPMAGRRRDVIGAELARRGRSRSEIARAVGVCERTAANYKRRVREDRQLGLDLPEPEPD